MLNTKWLSTHGNYIFKYMNIQLNTSTILLYVYAVTFMIAGSVQFYSFALVWSDDISTIVGYLMTNLVLYIFVR